MIVTINCIGILSAECNKVVSDNLGEIELFTVFENTDKMTHFNPFCRAQLKVFTILWKKKETKNNEIQRHSEHKIAIPAKGRKCT